MHWFLDPITKHYADFEGRIGRQEYWMYVLCIFGINIILNTIGFDLITGLLSLGLLVPNIAIATRRLHDIGKSGWWQLLLFLPIIGWIILLVWLATQTSPEVNKYGNPAVPKSGATATSGQPVASTTPPVTPATFTPYVPPTAPVSAPVATPADASNPNSSVGYGNQ